MYTQVLNIQKYMAPGGSQLLLVLCAGYESLLFAVTCGKSFGVQKHHLFPGTLQERNFATAENECAFNVTIDLCLPYILFQWNKLQGDGLYEFTSESRHIAYIYILHSCMFDKLILIDNCIPSKMVKYVSNMNTHRVFVPAMSAAVMGYQKVNCSYRHRP